MTDRLLCDVMLGKLATYLRMCGYDTAYALDRGIEADDAVLALARAENRTLLTRDRALAARAERSVAVEATDVLDQLRALRDAGYALSLDEPVRCSECNGRLERVARDADAPGYAPDPADRPVWRCPDCGRHYWQGSHWADVRARVAGL